MMIIIIISVLRHSTRVTPLADWIHPIETGSQSHHHHAGAGAVLCRVNPDNYHY